MLELDVQAPKRAPRGWDESIAGLEELERRTSDVGPAATTALRCVRERGADPRLMLLVLEAALEPRSPDARQIERRRRRKERTASVDTGALGPSAGVGGA